MGCGLDAANHVITDNGDSVIAENGYDWSQIAIPPSVSIDVDEQGLDPTGVNPPAAITWIFRALGEENQLLMVSRLSITNFESTTTSFVMQCGIMR